MGVAGGCVHGEVEAVGRAVCCVRGPGGVHSVGGEPRGRSTQDIILTLWRFLSFLEVTCD